MERDGVGPRRVDFASVISIAESIVDKARISFPVPGRTAPKFMPETGFVNPFFCVLTLCRFRTSGAKRLTFSSAQPIGTGFGTVASVLELVISS